jgi:hypothetical protein
MAVLQTLCSDCQMQCSFLIKMTFTILYHHLKRGAKKVLSQMLALDVKALLWKTTTLATDNVERTKLDDARCKWRVGTVLMLLARDCNL